MNGVRTMSISIGDRLPDASFVRIGADGPETVELKDLTNGRKVVLFGLPGAYTGPCSTIHLPSFMQTAEQFRQKGIDEILCVAVNDPFVLKAWGESSGAAEAGIALLGDAGAEFTKALGMEFTAPPIGLYDRSNRYAVVLDDGVITHANVDEPGVCEISTGEKLLEQL